MSAAEQMGRGGWVLFVPVLSLLLVGGAAMGWVFAVRAGGAPGAGRARLELTGSCAAEAKLAVETRLADYGLEARIEAPSPTLLVIETQTPGAADDLEALPRALAQQGRFEVWQGGKVRLTHFVDAGVQLSFAGTAVSLINLSEAVEAEDTEVRIDGQNIDIESINGGEVMLVAEGKTAPESLRNATDRVVAIRHPLPCALTVGASRWLHPPS